MHSALLLAIAALPFLGADALQRSFTARCGQQSRNQPTCKGSIFGNCCNKGGFCGSSSAYCGKGCQVGFGDCTSSIPTSAKSSAAPAKPSSTLMKSTTSSTKVIVVSVAPTSANSAPFTASTTSSTVTSSSIPATSPSSSAPSSSTLFTSASSSTLLSSVPATSSSSVPDVKISTDGSCGGTQGFTCSGSAFGDCCSEYGWCGATSSYCGAGCNDAFGNCGAVSTSIQPSSSSTPASSSSLAPSSFSTATRTTSAVPSATQAVSTDGACGASSDGLTCLGSTFGDCCSQYGYCGGTSAFCGTGCQGAFGECDAAPVPGNICGVEGFANKTEYYASSFNLISTTDVATCASLCLAEATCMSYLFNPGLQNCAYLTYTLEQGEFIATTGTNQLFWDRACAEAPAA